MGAQQGAPSWHCEPHPLGLTGLDHSCVSPLHLEEAPAQGSTAKVGRAGKEEGCFHSA